MDFGDLCGAINSQFTCALLDRVTQHTFRDTYASRLVQAGVSLVKVQKLLGHSSPNMKQKYAHLSPDATGQEAAAVLDGSRD